MVRDASLRDAPHHEVFETPRYARLLRACESFGKQRLPRLSCCDSIALSAKQGLTMADEQLFEDLPEQARPQADLRGAPRLREPERTQVSLHVSALDDL